MFNCDNIKTELQCPRCKFFNPFTLKQVRLRDVIICRGCKANIRLDDYLNECRVAVREINTAFQQLQKSLKGLTINLKL